MAEKKEPRKFVDTVLKWAKWGAISFLGMGTLMATGILPLAAINTALTFAVNGALYGGLGGAAVGTLNEIRKALGPKQTAPAT
jgi:hypothetical protein